MKIRVAFIVACASAVVLSQAEVASAQSDANSAMGAVSTTRGRKLQNAGGGAQPSISDQGAAGGLVTYKKLPKASPKGAPGSK